MNDQFLESASDSELCIAFTEFFEGTQDSEWGRFDFIDEDGKCCALGLCGDRMDIATPVKAIKLKGLFNDNLFHSVITTNDGENCTYKQATPKLRILAALSDISQLLNQLNHAATSQKQRAN